MEVIDLLASKLSRRDDEPNQALADEFIKLNRKDWIQELVLNLNNKDKNFRTNHKSGLQK